MESTLETMPKPRILSGGSLDVDNFGDLLFFLITEKYLPDVEFIPTAPFGWDMTVPFGRRVHRYVPLLASEPVDAIWTPGGEIGGASTFDGVFKLSAPPEAYKRFMMSTETQRRKTIEENMGGMPVPQAVHPYIPPNVEYPINANAITVVNSMGMSQFMTDLPDSLRVRRHSFLHELAVISVRDRESSKLLTSLDISHTLAPDLVHTLRILLPPTHPVNSDIAIFQIDQPTLMEVGIENMARALAACTKPHNLRIRILMTGTWRGADSMTDNSKLVNALSEQAPDRDIKMILTRRPFELVDHIRRARVVIGTSLHLRIVACAYDVPRVTLIKPFSDKLTRYSRLWDPDMPYDVSVDDLGSSLSKALERAHDTSLAEQSNQLSRLADENLKKIVAYVMSLIAKKRELDAT